MDETRVQATKPAPPSTAITSMPPRPTTPSIRKSGIGYYLYRGVTALASLRLTVFLFALSIILVFCGTLAQVDSGLWTAISTYFRNDFLVWIPFRIFFPRAMNVAGGFPFPGGYLLGWVLMANLIAAHAIRFKFTPKRLGIIILHSGLVIMMVSEYVTGKFATEGSMLIFEGQSANYVMHPRETELAIIPEGTSDNADVIAVPMKLMQRGGVIKDDALPFDVEVVKYMINSQLYKQEMPAEFLHHDFAKLPLSPLSAKNLATAGLVATHYLADDRPETGGVEHNKEDRPAAYVRFRDKQSGRDLGAYLVAVLLEDTPQSVAVDGKNYDVRLRLKRTYKPYTRASCRFRHDIYPGTKVPLNYSSRVRLIDPSKGVDRETLIYMNNPLYYGGETFYQQSFRPATRHGASSRAQSGLDDALSFVLMVGLGLVPHFGITLVGFLSTGSSAEAVDTRPRSSVLPGVIAAGAGAAFISWS